MDEQELLKERFKSAVTSAIKTISEDFDIEVKFGDNSPSKKNIRLKQLLSSNEISFRVLSMHSWLQACVNKAVGVY